MQWHELLAVQGKSSLLGPDPPQTSAAHDGIPSANHLSMDVARSSLDSGRQAFMTSCACMSHAVPRAWTGQASGAVLGVLPAVQLPPPWSCLCSMLYGYMNTPARFERGPS